MSAMDTTQGRIYLITHGALHCAMHVSLAAAGSRWSICEENTIQYIGFNSHGYYLLLSTQPSSFIRRSWRTSSPGPSYSLLHYDSNQSTKAMISHMIFHHAPFFPFTFQSEFMLLALRCPLTGTSRLQYVPFAVLRMIPMEI